MKSEKLGLWALLYRCLGLCIGILGIVLHFLADRVADVGFMVRHKLAYFTIQTNVMVVVLFGYLIYRTVRQHREQGTWAVAHISAGIHLGIAYYITITMAGFWLLLVPATGINHTPLVYWSSMLLHTVTPLLAIGDRLLFGQHGGLSRKTVLPWLGYPAAYLVFVMLYSRTIRTPYYSFRMGGKLVELMYPYPFLDPQVMGVKGVILAAGCLVIVFTVPGLLYIGIDNGLGKLQKKAEKA